jgi:CRISPR type III-B/RAMP module-associated protein Cmr3
MDGADTGQRVSGARTPPLKGVLAGKAWDYFCQGKDGKGGWKPKGVADLPADAKEIRRPLSPSFHAALSEAIPMAAGQGRGRGCRLPFPSTVHEALRASLMLANGKLPDGKREPGRPQNAPRKGNWHATGVETDRWLASKAYRSLVTVGPFPCLGPKKCKEDPEPGLRFPVPPDVAFDPPLKSDKDASTPVHLRRLELWFDLDAVGPTADAGQPYRPLCLPVATTPLAQENPPRGWWTAQQYVEYLRGETRADKFHPTPESALWEAEHRVGVEIDPSSSAAAEGQLYAASFMRPRGNLRFALQADLIDRRNGEAEELDRLDWLLLGGERRLARVRHDTMAPVWSDLPRAPAVSGDAPCVLKWVLVTPAIFAHGSLPGWCAHPPGKPDGRPLGDVRLGQSERKREDGRLPGRAVLAGWCLGKPLAISGWDAAENLAKPTQLAVPAGSVYYFLCENGATATALAARLHWKPRSDMYGEKGCGYGFCRADASLHEAGGSIEQLRRLLFAGGNG